MNKPDKAGEPSMDEILSSIRKIIAEEPIGSQSNVKSGTGEPSANTADTLGRVRLGGGSEILGVAAEETTHSSAQSTNLLSQTPADIIGGNQRQETTTSMQSFEPQLPMPGNGDQSGNQQEDNQLDSPSLSSRLANALRGDVPSSPAIATEATFDDDDLSAALDDAPPTPDPAASAAAMQSTSLNVASFKERLTSLTMKEENSASDLASPTSDATDFPSAGASDTESESVADPFSALRNVSVVATTEPEAKAETIAETPEPEPLEETTEDAANPKFIGGLQTSERSFSDDQNGVRAPLFETGPQPPSSLRPRAFSTSGKSEPSLLSGDGQTDTTPASNAVSESEAPTIEEPVAGRGDGVEKAPVEPINSPAHPDIATASTQKTSNDGGQEELVGLAAAVAAKQQVPVAKPTGVAETLVDEVARTTAVPSGKEKSDEEPIVQEEANATSIEQGPTSDSAPEVTASPTAAVVEPSNSVMSAGSPSATQLTSAAVTASISPTGVQTLEDTVAELLRPLLREWLTENMPRIVEKALRIEMASSVTTDASSSDGVQIDSDVSHDS